jgi:CrcB protein
MFTATGILGGFTTFSVFSLDAALLWQRGEMAGAAVYVATSVSLAMLGIFAGLFIARTVLN